MIRHENPATHGTLGRRATVRLVLIYAAIVAAAAIAIFEIGNGHAATLAGDGGG